MAQQKDGSGGTYLYAVIAGGTEKTYGPIGIDDSEVYCLSHGPVAAIVSDLTHAALRPQRRHLAAHERVLKRLLEAGSPLPMSFGAIADGPEDIRLMLASHADVLVEQLERVHGRVEMGLRVRWDIPNPIEYLVDRHDELRAARDQVFRSGREPSPAERMELGRLVENLLREERATRAERVERDLHPYCAEIKEGKLRDERELVCLACLIERGSEDAFARGVVEAASHFDAHCCFDYNGPWPAHSFVDLNLHW